GASAPAQARRWGAAAPYERQAGSDGVVVHLSDAAYRAALDALFARTTGQWKLGLERVTGFLAELGDPQRRLRVLHVAGTNGKGSVCAMLEAALRARGLRVGKYTSPHLVDFRERFVVDGRPVEDAAIAAWLERWTPTVERVGATFFEATTAMGFQLFVDAGVDIAVIETRSEEHTSELQSRENLVCRLLL